MFSTRSRRICVFWSGSNSGCFVTKLMLEFRGLAAAHLLMRRSLLLPIPAPIWPTGINLVPFAPEHALAAHALLVEAYAQGGGSVPARFVPWWDGVSSDEEFDESLCFVAMAGDGSMAGFALCWTSSFVKDIAVAPAHRRKGIGEALLLAAFRELKSRGHEQVGLKVETDNPSGARRLYERLGFVLG
jgi:GNAT superfamily N-acetyltransferase